MFFTVNKAEIIVSCSDDILYAKQNLIKFKQDFIDLKNIIIPMPDKIGNDDVKLTASCECVSGSSQKVLSLLHISSRAIASATAVCLEG